MFDIQMMEEKNKGQIKVNKGMVGNSPSFSSYGIKPLLKTLQTKAYKDSISRNNLLLDVIRIKQPISIYELAKITGLSYPTIKQICRWLEASVLIKTRVAMGNNSMPVKLVYIEEEKNDTKTT